MQSFVHLLFNLQLSFNAKVILNGILLNEYKAIEEVLLFSLIKGKNFNSKSNERTLE